jgi:phosphate transport system substrate-binding protein
VGGVVPVVNLEGVRPGQLRLTGPVLADIFLRKITRWNAKAISDLNPGLALPDQPIIPIHRVDGSGTTFVFADYLARVSGEWKDRIGVGMSVEFPTGIGAKGNDGIAGLMVWTKGAIGYVEHTYAVRGKLAYVSMQNREGAFVLPSRQSFQSAVANADWAGALASYASLAPIGPAIRLGPLQVRRLCSFTSNSKSSLSQIRCSNSLTGPFTPAPSWPRSWSMCRCRRMLFL